MSILSKEVCIYDPEIKVVKETEDCGVVYKMKHSDGEGSFSRKNKNPVNRNSNIK